MRSVVAPLTFIFKGRDVHRKYMSMKRKSVNFLFFQDYVKGKKLLFVSIAAPFLKL